MRYTNIPAIVEDLISRLAAEATSDGYIVIANRFTALEPVTWFNLPYQLNKIMDIIGDYQTELLDGDVQDLLDEIGTIYWFNIFKKVSLLVELTELIESI